MLNKSTLHQIAIIGTSAILASAMAYAVVKKPANNHSRELAQCSIHYYVAANLATAREDDEDRIYYGILSNMVYDQAEPGLSAGEFSDIVKVISEKYTKLFDSNPEAAVRYVVDSVQECDKIVEKPKKSEPKGLTTDLKSDRMSS